MWWNQLKQVEHIDESNISWNPFKKYFQHEYLSEHYYDKKMQRNQLGSMTMREYENNFLGLLIFVRFIKDEKVKIQSFLCQLPYFIKIKFNMMNPKP
jgi:hypothetical protein